MITQYNSQQSVADVTTYMQVIYARQDPLIERWYQHRLHVLGPTM